MEEDKPKGFLLAEAQLFIEEKRPCVGLTIAKPTFAYYIYAAQLIESYLRERLGLEDIRYAQLSYAFIEGLDFYLKPERNLSLATIQIVVIFLRKLIGIGSRRSISASPPLWTTGGTTASNTQVSHNRGIATSTTNAHH